MSDLHRSDIYEDEAGGGFWYIHARSTLPAEDFHEFYGDEPVWVFCHGMKYEVRDRTDEKFEPHYRCAGCEGRFTQEEVIEKSGKLYAPRHKHLLTIYEQAREKMTEAIKAMGLDPHSESLREAVWEVDNRRSGEPDPHTIESLLAKGTLRLGEILTRRAAVEQTQKAVTKLAGLNVSDEFCGFPEIKGYGPTKNDRQAPFFTEAFLYNLLGKEAARTVLAYFHQVQRATGA